MLKIIRIFFNFNVIIKNRNLVKYFAVKHQKALPFLPHKSVDILEKYLDEPFEYEKSLEIV